MQMEHNFTVPAPVDTVWEALLDLERVVPCMPGATLTSHTGEEFAGTVKVRLGPISLQYKGNGKFTEIDVSARMAVIEASGRDARGNGTASATVVASMREDGGDTAVTVVTDLSVTGKPAQFGRGMISEVGSKIISQFADCLAGSLGYDGEEPAAATPAAAVPPAAVRPVRPLPAPVTDEINLLDAAGGSVLKRMAPAAGGLLLLLLVVRWSRNR